MIFNGRQIAAACGGTLVQEAGAGPIYIDSRRGIPGGWYVALAGERFDGHSFLPLVAASGCNGAIVSRPIEGWTKGLVVVEDCLKALQDLGAAARNLLTVPIVGITGSAGKTSTRVLVVEVLRPLGMVHHTQGNLNNHIGLPLTLVGCPLDADAVVLELGMNHPGEIQLLAQVGRPNVRLITNVGAAHVEGCGSIEGVAAAKQELFDTAQSGDILCVNVDDPRIAAMPVPPGTHVIRYGSGPRAQIRLTDVSVDRTTLQTRLRLETPDGVIRAVLPVPGAHLAINAAAAAAVAFALRIPIDSLPAAFARFAPEGMRNRVERLGDWLVLDDAYNANPLSMVAALRTLVAMPGPHIAVLGDMLELGSEEEAAHIQVLEEAQRLGIRHILVCGERMSRAAPNRADCFADVDSLARALAQRLRSIPAGPKSILIKGSRGARMERVLDHLRAEAKCSTT